MNYALGHCFHLKHIFENFNLKKLKMSCNDCLEITGNTQHRDILAEQIFKDSVKLVINDIIDHNITFQFPKVKAWLHMSKTTGDEFVAARQNGKWMEVDFIASFWTGYQIMLTMFDKNWNPARTKLVYVDKKLQKKITDNTNKGKQYY